MKFGVCCGLKDARAVVDAGFDYVELGASGFSGLSEHWDRSPYANLPIYSTNLFFDGSIKLFEDPDKELIRVYSRRTIARAASLGVSVMVVGSGASRRAPEGVDGDLAFARFVSEISAEAGALGITLAPESLNRTETNVGNDLARFATVLRDHRVAYTADSYHVLYEWNADGRVTPLDELWGEQLPFAPAHVHIADLPRDAPKASEPMLLGFVKRLSELRYDAGVSLECKRESDFDFRRALSDLRSLFKS